MRLIESIKMPIFIMRRLLIGFLLIGLFSIGGCSDSNSGDQNEARSDATATDQTQGENGPEPVDPQGADTSTDGHATDGNPAASDSHTTQNTNRLVEETSPYLRMHAHNPVDWYPWGDEALQKAKDENKERVKGYVLLHKLVRTSKKKK